MLKMRLGWYAGVSTALAGSVVISAFHQRANFYSAMVYLAQSNFCLLVLINFILLVYSSLIYALVQICFGTLRAIELEQLTERAWFAITETCLAMTIFREEIGAWFLVMFTALVTGKVWGWIGEGRVEFLEQQPPPNPRLFHIRLSISLAMSLIYDVWLLHYTINTVIQEARPNMMVMFLFEFAVLSTSTWRTGVRYILSLMEQKIIKNQTQKRFLERRDEVTRQRQDMIRQREQAAAAGEEVSREPLPDPDDIDEMDIEVPGWVTKGEWVLWLDLLTDMIKLGLYVAFFLMLLTFYGLPIHIMRDLFMTARDFLKRLSALIRYRRAIQEMNKYPDATEQELGNENTCIICREEMHHWVPAMNAVDRVRPKKLPCGHILHLGCLKSWLERQQVCPTCRSPVTGNQQRGNQGPRAAGFRIQIGGVQQQAQERQGQEAMVDNNRNNGNNHNHNNGNNFNQNQNHDAPQQQQQQRQQQGGAQNQNPAPAGGQPHMFTFGPIRIGFGTNGPQVRQLAQRFGIPQVDGNQGGHQAAAESGVGAAGTGTASTSNTQPQQPPAVNLQNVGALLQQAEQLVHREMTSLQATQQELQVVNLLLYELQRLRQRSQSQDANQTGHSLSPIPAINPHPPTTIPLAFPPGQQLPPPFPAQAAPVPGLSPYHHGFAGVPPRISSPLMTRHGPMGNPTATTIPAGSPDLPEGLTLPAGWSLAPLQRLDGATTASPATAAAAAAGPNTSQSVSQAGISPHIGGESSSSASQPPAPSIQPTHASAIMHEQIPAETSPLIPGLSEASTNQMSTLPQPAQVHDDDNNNDDDDAASSASPSTSATQVMSPSPVMPNWGGSAQLFSSGSRLDNSEETAPQSTPQGLHLTPTTTTTILPQEPPVPEPNEPGESSASHIHPGEASSDKGKGRAVTMEEADDDLD